MCFEASTLMLPIHVTFQIYRSHVTSHPGSLLYVTLSLSPSFLPFFRLLYPSVFLLVFDSHSLSLDLIADLSLSLSLSLADQFNIHTFAPIATILNR